VCEQSWWMKGICFLWSRDRHFSPSLPDRGPTQGRGPTGIWLLAHSISDPRAEISGILVMVRRSSTTSRSTTYWFPIFLGCWFLWSTYFACACARFQNCSTYCRQEKNTLREIKETESSIPGSPLTGESHYVTKLKIINDGVMSRCGDFEGTAH